MSDVVGFAFLAGASIGFLFGLIAVAGISASTDKSRVRRGVMNVDGAVYKLTEIKP